MSAQQSRPVRVKRELQDRAVIDLSDDPQEPAKISCTMPNIPAPLLQIYQQMLPSNPAAIKYLYSSDFAEALDETAFNIAAECRITKEQALEEFRRFIAIKMFTVDDDATKISPTPISMCHSPIPKMLLSFTFCGNL